MDIDVTDLLASFPDADPSRPFDATKCVRIVLRAGLSKVELPSEAAQKKRLFQSGTFWDLLLATFQVPQYIDYSFKERADVYSAPVTTGAAKALAEGSKLLAYTVLADQLRAIVPDTVDFYLPR